MFVFDKNDVLLPLRDIPCDDLDSRLALIGDRTVRDFDLDGFGIKAEDALILISPVIHPVENCVFITWMEEIHPLFVDKILGTLTAVGLNTCRIYIRDFSVDMDIYRVRRNFN